MHGILALCQTKQNTMPLWKKETLIKILGLTFADIRMGKIKQGCVFVYVHMHFSPIQENMAQEGLTRSQNLST